MIGRKTSPAVVMPRDVIFEYDAYTVHTGVDDDLARLDHYINAKALQGWTLHTCQRIGESAYFVVMGRLMGRSEER